MTVRIIQGDCRCALEQLPADSIHCVVTSPPYWQLRDYGHPDQLGLEATPQLYVEALVAALRHVRRVLRPDGTLWLNLGDTYIGGRNGGIGTNSKLGSQRNHNAARAAWKAGGGRSHRRCPGFKRKDLVGIPWRVAIALQEDGWWLRSDIIWHKPSPMPERVLDRPTRAHEHVFLLAKSDQYFYDADAIKEPASESSHARGDGLTPKAAAAPENVRSNSSFSQAVSGLVEFRNKRDVWTIPQEPYSEAHFSTFPRGLVRPCVLAGCPVDGTVLDPFAGAGTVGLVANRLGRDVTLVELNPKFCELARQRIADDSPVFAGLIECFP